MREGWFERGGVTSVALLTADVVPAVSRTVPIGLVVGGRSIGP